MLTALLVVIAAPLSTGAVAGGEGTWQIRITTQDGEGKPLAAPRLEWWRSGDAHHKHVLRCPDGACTRWSIDASNTGANEMPLSIHIVAPIPKPGDAFCWDMHEGDLLIDLSDRQEDVPVRLVHTHAVCA